MKKSDELKKMYKSLELDSTEELVLLSKVKNLEATEEEYFDLIELVEEKEGGAKKLEEIRDFEQALITEMNDNLNILEGIIDEYHAAAHEEEEEVKEHLFSIMKEKYQIFIAKSEAIMDAIEISYFQTKDFSKFGKRLYVIKDELRHFE